MRLPVFVRVLTGAATDSDSWWTGQILLAWFLTTIATHSTSKRIFVMTGHEKKLLRYGVGEAFANLALSITLLKIWASPASVAVGSIIPTLLFGWFGLWPWVSREAGISPMALLRKTAGAGTVIALAVAIPFVAGGWIHGHGDSPELVTFLIESTVAALFGAAAAAFVLRDEIRVFRNRHANIVPALV
jgi:hypothetical protein